MSSVKIESNASGTGIFTIASPNSNTNRTLTLPDQTGTVLTGSGAIGVNASAPTNSLAIDSSGNVGIGTSSPTQRLHISGSSSITRLRIESTGSVASSINFTTTSDANGFINYDTGEFKFFNNSGGSATERMRITSGGDLQFNSGYGSVATAYGCRAWVNFNGTGTVAIRASGNVTSITDNGVGNYAVNFTNALSDANYSTNITILGGNAYIGTVNSQTSSVANIYSWTTASAFWDSAQISVAIFR